MHGALSPTTGLQREKCVDTPLLVGTRLTLANIKRETNYPWRASEPATMVSSISAVYCCHCCPAAVNDGEVRSPVPSPMTTL